MIKIYLAGYSEEIEYRKHVTRKYGNRLDIFDPMKEIDSKILEKKKSTGLSDSDCSLIVEQDKTAITTCDLVIVYIKQPSFGTAMEILHSYNNRIPIYVIDHTLKFRNDVWVRYHATKFFDSIDLCLEYILKSIKGF